MPFVAILAAFIIRKTAKKISTRDCESFNDQVKRLLEADQEFYSKREIESFGHFWVRQLNSVRSVFQRARLAGHQAVFPNSASGGVALFR
jgi:hypothetical protein